MNKTTKRRIAAAALVGGLALTGTACARDSDRVSENLSKEADSFEVERKIVFLNGITDTELLVIEGKCAIMPDGENDKMDVVCKTGPDAYKKHSLGLSDNVTYFSEQVEPNDVSEYHYKVIIKPENIIPDIDLQTGDQ